MDFSNNSSSASHKALAALIINRHRENKFDAYKSSFDEYSKNETQRIFNQRLVNLSNLPVNSYHKNNRHTASYIRACQGTHQNTAQSLDMLRQIIQSSINEEINKILQRYINIYFLPAKANINANNVENNEVTQEHMHHVCCQILEEAKKMYVAGNEKQCDNKVPHIKDTYVQNNSHELESVRPRKRKRTFSSGSDSKLPLLSKKLKSTPVHCKTHSGRSTPNKTKHTEPVKKEGAKWDPKRLTTDTEFIMGSKANKALGLGATRGRLYIKHPDLFKYGGDQDDKQWLFENIHMPATGGRTYLLILEDIKVLAQMDEYRNSPGLSLSELIGFTVPHWMIQKMKILMNSQRTDKHVYNPYLDDHADSGSELKVNDNNDINSQKISIIQEESNFSDIEKNNIEGNNVTYSTGIDDNISNSWKEISSENAEADDSEHEMHSGEDNYNEAEEYPS